MATVLITGAARGIGKDAAFVLAKRGHRVIATVHHEAQVKALQGEAEEMGIKLDVRKLDINSEADVDAVSFEAIDVLVNNAAINDSGPMAEVPIERIERLLETNVIGTLRLTQKAAQPMLARKSGRIILVSSIAGRVMLPYLGPYSMTKFAVEAMGDALRRECSPFGVHVSLVEPGLIYTGFNEEMAARKYEWLKESSAFAADIAAMRRHDEKITKSSSGTASVVEAIVHAVESSSPRARYVRPRFYGFMVGLAKFIPTPVMDRLMRKFAGLL